MGHRDANADQLERVYTTMFDAVADDDSMGSLVDAQMVINFRLDDPDADIDHPVTGHRELLGPLNQTAMSRQVFAVCQA